MTERRDDLVELVGESGGSGDPGTGSPVPRSPDEPADAVTRWWRSLPVLDRFMALGTAVVLVVAVCVGVSAAHQRHSVLHLTRVQRVDNPVPGVDALGCPVTTTCRVRVLPSLRALVILVAPQLSVESSMEVVDARTAKSYRRELFAHDPRDELSTVRVISACVPGGIGNRAEISGISQQYANPPGGGFAAPTRTLMTPVRNGCFGYVSYQATHGISSDAPTSLAPLLALISSPLVAVHR